MECFEREGNDKLESPSESGFMHRYSLSMQQNPASILLTSHFRCPDDVADFDVRSPVSCGPGHFQSHSDSDCHRECSSGFPPTDLSNHLPVACRTGTTFQFPGDAVQAVDNLRFERYTARSTRGNGGLTKKNVIRNVYYTVRPFLPVAVRKYLQQIYLRGWDKVPFPAWPVDRTVENILEQVLVFAMKSRNVNRVPFIWFWPDGARSCAIMTHDVETLAGLRFCSKLMDLNESFGIKSSFQIVPEDRYDVPPSFLENIRMRGFEVNVHDLNHDGHLFSNREQFLCRARQINNYGQQWGAVGFRSAILYRNVDWYDALDFSYDMSVPNVAHLDPQRGGCCTVFPYFIGKSIELPVTTIQDYSLFHILNDYSIRLWKQQISLIQEKHGLISFIIHPDYIIAKTARRVYADLLQYLSELRSTGGTWIALPREVAEWWRLRNELRLVREGGSWHIEGQGSERARVAYAVLAGDNLTFEFDEAAQGFPGLRQAFMIRNEELIAS